jgi:hypothetical protein
MNATKSGIFARQPLLPREDQRAFARLGKALRDRYAPEDALEETFVDQIATATWRLVRLNQAEAGYLTKIQEAKYARALAQLRDGPAALFVERLTFEIQDLMNRRLAPQPQCSSISGHGDGNSEVFTTELRILLDLAENIDTTMFEAHIAADERNPLEQIGRQRRSAIKEILKTCNALEGLRARKNSQPRQISEPA